ncbi:DNA (cytosine-5-)-methyltransferase [Polynucleobacter sp. MWH-P3-07-1]|uniref:DNA (cytosine-5-)-methyltransferase n=1 Tax=Polynucleobacter sp. MWH-P3-07-1 TaxID=1743173 RepID=UPI001BFD4FBE|nr:DNA (cytosine-5-)-methyltransferase [Polynucleobacter sp. MWH-P3-07-1]QWD83177.1 DNA (cytosine-5-)-methyltransferase [Polynucleobacter sp. MWH-P3-07-1]
MNSATHISISDASEKLAVSLDTIRRWEKKGLIKAHRAANGHRYFDKKELDRLIAKNGGSGDVGYKVLKAKKKSPFSVVELFAGAGGLALGMENAGLDCNLLVEIDKKAVETLRTNRPKWNVVDDDIANVDFKKIKADVVAGGFPCQAFSYAGKRMGFEDTRGTLFFEYARAVKEIKPKVILGENVKGLERHDNGRTLETMLNVLDELGYDVSYKILRAQYFDVAQKRERLVILGVRKDLKRAIAFPKEQNYTVGIREALKGAPKAEGQKYTPEKKKIMELIPPGGYWRDLPLPLQKKYMGASFYLGGGKTGMARRLSWDEPSLTLTCNPAQKQTERCHPGETRPLNVREYARIQSFPDEWAFSGSTASQYKQIGNAVPVNLGYHIGRAIIAMLSNSYDEKSLVVLEHKLI